METNNQKQTIFLVDDDSVFLKLLEIEFRLHTNFEIRTFETGEECIQSLKDLPFAIVLDYHLDGINPDAMNGINTLDSIKEFNKDIPVIMLSSQDKIEVAVDCMHHKAIDYIVKSETAFLRLQKIIDSIQRFDKLEGQLNWYMDRM
jgi:DNA-binding NtrC family response regulator